MYIYFHVNFIIKFRVLVLSNEKVKDLLESYSNNCSVLYNKVQFLLYDCNDVTVSKVDICHLVTTHRSVDCRIVHDVT